MPGDPRECRQHAVNCLEHARTASSPEAKAKFLDLADTWLKLAADLEAMRKLLAEEKTD